MIEVQMKSSDFCILKCFIFKERCKLWSGEKHCNSAIYQGFSRPHTMESVRTVHWWAYLVHWYNAIWTTQCTAPHWMNLLAIPACGCIGPNSMRSSLVWRDRVFCSLEGEHSFKHDANNIISNGHSIFPLRNQFVVARQTTHTAILGWWLSTS